MQINILLQMEENKQEPSASSTTNNPASRKEEILQRSSLGVKIIGSSGVKSGQAGAASGTGRTLVRGSRAAAVKKDETASVRTSQQTNEEDGGGMSFDELLQDPQPRASIQGNRSSMSLTGGAVAKKRRTTVLSEKDFDQAMASTMPPGTVSSKVIKEEDDEGDDSPKQSKDIISKQLNRPAELIDSQQVQQPKNQTEADNMVGQPKSVIEETKQTTPIPEVDLSQNIKTEPQQEIKTLEIESVPVENQSISSPIIEDLKNPQISEIVHKKPEIHEESANEAEIQKVVLQEAFPEVSHEEEIPQIVAQEEKLIEVQNDPEIPKEAPILEELKKEVPLQLEMVKEVSQEAQKPEIFPQVVENAIIQGIQVANSHSEIDQNPVIQTFTAETIIPSDTQPQPNLVESPLQIENPTLSLTTKSKLEAPKKELSQDLGFVDSSDSDDDTTKKVALMLAAAPKQVQKEDLSINAQQKQEKTNQQVEEVKQPMKNLAVIQEPVNEKKTEDLGDIMDQIEKINQISFDDLLSAPLEKDDKQKVPVEQPKTTQISNNLQQIEKTQTVKKQQIEEKTIPLDSLIEESEQVEEIIQKRETHHSSDKEILTHDPKRMQSKRNRTGKVFIEDNLDILAQIENLEANDAQNDEFVQNFDTMIQDANNNTRNSNEGSSLRQRRVGFETVMSADSNDNNKAPLSGRGRGTSSDKDSQDNAKSGNLRQGTYQKRTIESSPPQRTPAGGANLSGMPPRHRMTLRELELVLPQENSDLESDEDRDHYLEKLQLEEKKSRSTQQLITEIRKMTVKEPLDASQQQSQPQKDVFVERPQNLAPSVSLSAKPKQPKMQANKQARKDLIDIIEEIEDEGEASDTSKQDEDKQDQVDQEANSEDEAAREYYSKMYDESKDQEGSSKLQDKANEGKANVPKILEKRDIMGIYDIKERKYQEDAKALVKKNSILAASLQNQNHSQVKTRIVSDFKNLNTLTTRLVKEHQLNNAQSTCIGLNHEHILLGNSEGQVQFFLRDTEKYVTTFSEKSKDFIGNGVTSIDVHPLRPEYVIVGYEKGQMILLDTRMPVKSLKVIKESSSRGVPIVTAKFCDWSGPQGKLYNIVKDKLNNRASQAVKQDSQDDNSQEAWMIISIDADGVVAVTTVIKIMIVYKVSRYVVVDPATSKHHIFSVVSTRFRSPVHGAGIYDHLSFIALANRDKLLVLETGSTSHRTLLSMDKPDKFYNAENGNYDPFLPYSVPSLGWGHGMSPVLKERSHSMLAIGWGPIVQLVVLIDEVENDRPFILDGYYIVHTIDMMKQGVSRQMRDPAVMEVEEESKKGENQSLAQRHSISEEDEFLAFKQADQCYIEGLYFLSDSTILILLSGQEMRILDTQSFRPEGYDPESIVNNPKKTSRMSVSTASSDGKQCLHIEELEIGIRCQPVIKSEHGIFSSAFPLYQQTMKYFNGKFVMMTTKGIQSCQHLTWQQSILDFQKSQNARQSSAIIQDNGLNYDEEEDMAQVFLRALELYKGRVKGYQGLIDNAYLRESFLRAELKLFVKEIIQQMVEETTNNAQKQSKSVASGALSQSEEKAARYYKFTKIVRIAIEFCVELKDCDFLFKDLCWLFQDHGGIETEKIFINELENFILAGKFSEWELPPEVIDSFVKRYYLHEKKKNEGKNLASPYPETFEKIIVNLNVSQCTKDTILQYVKYCEEHFLTTGIIYLYTQLLEKKDNASCVQVLFSLYDLYKRAPDQTMTKQQLIAMTDLENVGTAKVPDQSSKRLDRSHIYLGYKLFWLIKMYINGRKFPNGLIKEAKWRSYVHDVVQFLSNPEILGDLAILDAETLFQVISVLFLRTSKPFNLVLQGRDNFASAGPSDFNARFIPHWDFLKDMDDCFLGGQSKVPVQAKRQYLFFISNVIVRDRELSNLPQAIFYRALKELFKHSKEYFEFNRDLYNIKKRREAAESQNDGSNFNYVESNVEDLVRLVAMMHFQTTNSVQPNDQQSDDTVRQVQDDLLCLQKTENDYLNLLRKCEPLDNKQIDELLVLSESTDFEQVQLYLLERKEEYVKCLQLLLREAEKKRYATTNQFQYSAQMRQSRIITETAKLPIATQLLVMNEIGAQADRKGERTIKWLIEKIAFLQARVEADPNDSHAAQQIKELKKETFIHMKKLLQLSRIETIKLIEERFDGITGHKHVMELEPIRKDPFEQLLYLETFLEEYDQQVQEAIRVHSMGESSNTVATQAKHYIEFIKLRLKLCCQLKPERVFGTVEQMVKSRKGSNQESYFFPVEECLQICAEYNQIEAQFLLNKKLGKYYEAILQGLKILRTKLSLRKLKIEVYFAKQNDDLSIAYPISSSHTPECYFFDAVFKRIVGILVKHSKDIEEEKEEKVWFLTIDAILDLKQSPEIAFKSYCKRFFQSRLNHLVEAMSRQISFKKFLDHSLGRYQETQFKDFQEIILHVINNQISEENILLNANSAIAKVNNIIFENFSMATRFGVPFRSKICHICKKYLTHEEHQDHHMAVDNEIEEALLLEDEQDPMNDEFVKVFACQHVFHFPCLRRQLIKKKEEVNYLYLKAGVNNLRCPVCNIGTLDIDTQLSKKPMMAFMNPRQRGGFRFEESNQDQPGNTRFPKDDELRKYRELEMKKAELRMTKRENIEQTRQQQSLDKMKRRMELFEQTNSSAGLTLDDFIKIDQVKVQEAKRKKNNNQQQEGNSQYSDKKREEISKSGVSESINDKGNDEQEDGNAERNSLQAILQVKEKKSRFKGLFKRA